MVRQQSGTTTMILVTLLSLSTTIHAFSTSSSSLPLTRVTSIHSSSSRSSRSVIRNNGSSSTTSLQMAQRMTPTRKTRKDDSFDRNVPEEEEEKEDEEILDFSEAQAKIKEDENKRRVEEGLTVGLTKEDEEEFNEKKGAYEDMRTKIRARASEEGFEKSVATKKAIEEATRRAMAGQSSATSDQMLDLSGFADKFVNDETDELTEEEQREIDKIANMPILEQIQEEISNTRFPTPLAIFQTACVMALIFAASATLILKGDATIRDVYMGFDFIPRPDEVYDFSDLDLPDGFMEQQDLEGNLDSLVKQATDTVDGIMK
mmetsp:Transcript_29746/g.54855  ORF Transcript_29746/g.54855 Transcript_29746/m.54855 type:complete len:318 (+) Transcript_29746:202-1155(+)